MKFKSWCGHRCVTSQKLFFPLTDLPECSNKEEARRTKDLVTKTMFDLARDSESFGCPLPCHRIHFDLDVSYFHENTLGEKVDDSEPNFTLYYYPGSQYIEKHIETLAYDFYGMLAAAGGNLGLMLGFSCLSVFLSVTKWIQSKITEK